MERYKKENPARGCTNGKADDSPRYDTHPEMATHTEGYRNGEVVLFLAQPFMSNFIAILYYDSLRDTHTLEFQQVKSGHKPPMAPRPIAW